MAVVMSELRARGIHAGDVVSLCCENSLDYAVWLFGVWPPPISPTWTTTISNGTSFNGGEGAWYADGKVWFTTKGDNRVWELDVIANPNKIRVIYDDSTSPNPVLTGVDNSVGSVSGEKA